MAYGALGLAYWLAIMLLGHTPAQLLHIMPLGTGAAFGVLLVAWLLALRQKAPAVAAV